MREIGDTWLHGELCWERTWMIYGVMVVLTPRIVPLISMLVIAETKEVLHMFSDDPSFNMSQLDRILK